MAAEAIPELTGKYTLQKNEKFEEFLGANGEYKVLHVLCGKSIESEH